MSSGFKEQVKRDMQRRFENSDLFSKLSKENKAIRGKPHEVLISQGNFAYIYIYIYIIYKYLSFTH